MIKSRRKQIRDMLIDIVDNMDAPPEYANFAHRQFSQDWLRAVSEEAANIARDRSHI